MITTVFESPVFAIRVRFEPAEQNSSGSVNSEMGSACARPGRILQQGKFELAGGLRCTDSQGGPQPQNRANYAKYADRCKTGRRELGVCHYFDHGSFEVARRIAQYCNL